MGQKLNKIKSREANKLIKPIQKQITEEFDQCDDEDIREDFNQIKNQKDEISRRDKVRNRKNTKFYRTNTNTQDEQDLKRRAFATKKGMRRSRSNVEALLGQNNRVEELRSNHKSMFRTNSILKKRGQRSNSDRANLRVTFKPKKSVIFFKTASSVMRFKKNLLKQSKLRMKRKKREEELAARARKGKKV